MDYHKLAGSSLAVVMIVVAAAIIIWSLSVGTRWPPGIDIVATLVLWRILAAAQS